MLRQKIVVGIVMLAVLSTAGLVLGQESTKNSPQSTSLFDQLDQFGKKLVGGIFPANSNSTSRQKTTSSSNRYRRAAIQKGFNQSRVAKTDESKQTTAPSEHPAQKASGTNSQSTGRRVMVMKNNGTRNISLAQRQTAVAGKMAQPQKQEIVADKPGESRPIHERLMGFSRSAFSSDPQQPDEAKTVAAAPTGKSDPSANKTQISKQPQQQAVAKKDSVKQEVLKKTPIKTDIDPDVAAALSQSLAKPKATANQTSEKTAAKTSKQPVTKQPATKTTTPAETPLVEKTEAKKSKTNPTETKSIEAKTPASKTVAAAADGSKKVQSITTQPKDDSEAKASGVLFERHSPMLNVRTMGPRHITVDKESTYTVLIDNLGKAEAAEVVVTLALPESADVLGADPSRGATRSLRAANGSRQFEWRLSSLAAGGSEKMALRIVPRKSTPIDMAVSWDFKPAASQTVIEVQQPKLEMRLDGPREVHFGQDQIFKLEISNKGNGPAEDVVITLMPVAVGSGLPSTHRLGAFPAGKKMVLEIALTARQTDGLAVKVDLHNEGKICAQLNEKILVRKAELELVADGPNMQYVGTVATYHIR
ncbi:MAG: hypothetical protein JXM70_15745, partial [Pirellulales bacterium]|nr:hypothetical protein [Pirellulales bacterium]